MGRAMRLLERAKAHSAALGQAGSRCVKRLHATLFSRVRHFDGHADLSFLRFNPRSGSLTQERAVRVGPNHFHALVTHPDGTVTDLGVSTNLLTNIGRDVWSSWMGGFIPTAQNAPATATSATSLTGTGSTWTASNLATPQLGCASFRVYAPVTGITTAPVYGNIVSNSTSVLTIDKWWNAADGTGTTPASTNSFIVAPGGIASVRFVGLTTNASAASASNTTLTSEITTNGGARALGTYAHTQGASTYTLTNSFSITGTLTAIHRAGAFVTLSAAGADPIVYETVLNVDATVANGDTLSTVWTFTLSG